MLQNLYTPPLAVPSKLGSSITQTGESEAVAGGHGEDKQALRDVGLAVILC